eukprot:384576_1
MGDEYSCEKRKFCELLGSNNQCQKASTKRTFEIYFSTIATKLNPNITFNQNELCNYKPLNVSLTVNNSIDCCSTSNCLAQFKKDSATNCPTFNAKLSRSIDKLFQCYIPDNIWIYAQCNNTNACTQILREHIDNYQWCACKALFDFLGVEGYDYLTILASWTQFYAKQIMSFVGLDKALNNCDIEEMELDCYPLIEECLVQIGTQWSYNDQCIENVYEGSVVELPITTIDNKYKYEYKTERNVLPLNIIIIIICVVVVSVCICVVILIFCRKYIGSNGRKQMSDSQHMKKLPSRSMTQGSFNKVNHINEIETTGEIEGHGTITKMESAIRLRIIENNVNNMAGQGEKKEEYDSDDDIYNEGNGKVVMTPKGNVITPKGFEENEYVTDNGYDNDERKQENVLLDSMLSDVLQMQDLDPNKIHQKNMENVKNNDTDSDDSDNMYEKSQSDNENSIIHQDIVTAGGEEQKDDNGEQLLDGMLSDIMNMDDLDPNKIHQIHVNSISHKQNNETESDESDNMYEK